MINCPKCQSPNIIYNKFDPQNIERVMNAAKATQSIGIPRISVLAGLGAMAVRAINELRRDYQCLDCQNKFDDGDCGVTCHPSMTN